jgi:threonine aldolase
MGAVLAGTNEFIARGRALRRMGVGGMRQTCIMAAAGIVALRRTIDLLGDDHRRAQNLWAGLSRIDERLVDRSPPTTNILRLHVKVVSENSQDEWLSALKSAGILGRRWGADMVRLITHRHIKDVDVERILFEINFLLKSKWLNYKPGSKA